MFVRSGDTAVDLDGYRIIVPCISVGNVAQLAVDLLINTLKLPRVGYLDDDSLLPLVGNDAFDHTGLSGHMHTAGEVYANSECKTAVVQLRTPIAKGRKLSFCNNLISWIKSVKFTEVILLTSSYSHERKDVQIRGEPYRFLLTPEARDLYTPLTVDQGWNLLEPRNEDEGSASSVGPDGVLSESQLFLPGSGLAKILYSQCCSEHVRLIMFVAFCSQGDNIHDAIAVAAKINSWLKLLPKENDRLWCVPSSWSLMYGGPSPNALF